jgi:alpha-D-ribose 1-methylphosphonate 5-triphosphate synthase subunit PhnG
MSAPSSTSPTHGTSLPATDTARRAWLAVLARAPRALLEQALSEALPHGLPPFDWLRAPETGLTMVRGRVGGSGDAFNLGEATVTRATLRLRATSEIPLTVGIAYQLGRDKRRAELAALSDALLQVPAYHEAVYSHLIQPLAAQLESQRATARQAAAATRVEFFTMVRGD